MKEINKIYIVSFLSGLTNAASITYTLYFLSHGLSQAQIGLLFGIFMIVMSIFNIPTGAIADMFGHKLSVFIGLILQAVSYFLFFAYPNYFGFLLGFIASGLGFAFQTGALSSLIFDILRKENLHADLQKVYGRVGGYALIAGIIASPMGSFIYKSNQGLPYFFSFLCFLAAAIVMHFVKWEFIRKTSSIANYFNIINQGIRLTIKNKILLGIVIVGSALTVNRLVFNQNIVQPYQIQIGIDVSYIGITAAVVSAVLAIVSFNSQRIYKFLGRDLALLTLVFIPSFSAIILSFLNSLLAIPIIILLLTGHTLRDPVFSHITQEHVDDDKRSTMSSTIAFLTAIIAGVALPYWGKGIDIFGIDNILFILGIFTFLIGVGGFIIIISKRKAVL